MEQRKLTPKGEQRRSHILDVARDLFTVNGYSGTSVAQIIEAAQVPKGVFYWYFSSKGSIFTEIIVQTQLSLRRNQQRAIVGSSNPIVRIEDGIRASAQWFSQNRYVFTLFQSAIAEPEFSHLISEGNQQNVSDVVAHIKEAIAQNLIADVDATVVAHSIIGVVNSLARHMLEDTGSKVTHSDISDAIVAFVSRGMGAYNLV